jgi:hypothetical protein
MSRRANNTRCYTVGSWHFVSNNSIAERLDDDLRSCVKLGDFSGDVWTV